MADLTGKTLTNGYPNLVTIGATTDDDPTTGQLENGKGNAITEIGVNKTPTAGIEFDVNGEIRAGDGILFGTDTAAANTLDDYEEGTWTPVYTSSTGSFTTMTMSVPSATYTKIGRQVTIRAYILTNDVDETGASGSLRISGLPFTSGSGNDGFSAMSIGFARSWSTTPDSGYIDGGTTNIILQKTNATANSVVADLTSGSLSSRNTLMILATYFT